MGVVTTNKTANPTVGKNAPTTDRMNIIMVLAS